MPKTSTERSRECRERKRGITNLVTKPLPKSAAQRAREYRARQKTLKANVTDQISQILPEIDPASSDKIGDLYEAQNDKEDEILTSRQESKTNISNDFNVLDKEELRILVHETGIQIEKTKNDHRNIHPIELQAIIIKTEPTSDEINDLYQPKNKRLLSLNHEHQACKPNIPDNFDVFGDLVARKLRNLNTRYAQTTVQHLINNVMYDAELGKYDKPMKNSLLSN